MGKSRILVVDDERVVSLDIQAALKRLGYSVAGAAVTGEQSVDMAGKLRPDLVLMDVKLQGEMDGIEAAERISRLFDVPVIFLTAYSDEDTLARAKMSGPFGFLLKPFEERDLHSAIEVALYKHQMEQDLHRAKRAAEAANEAKTSFLATISHELRTPMNGILGMTELVMLSHELPEDVRDNLQLVKDSALTLMSVLNQILDYSKMEAKILELREGEFALVPLLEKTLEPHRLLAEKKGVEFDLEVSSALPRRVKGDSGRLRQIVNNIVGNAVKFTDSGFIRVKVALCGDDDCKTFFSVPRGQVRLHFTVRDSGCGIPEGKEDLIFESFTQVEDYMTRRQGGLGLGLAIAKRLVALMGGEIWVECDQAGSCFHFTCIFSLLDEDVDVHGSTASDLAGMTILVAEDNYVNRRFVVRSLEMLGARVKEAENGLEALNATQEDMFDAVLMDIQLPVLDGIEATRKLRDPSNRNQNMNTPVIALTAHAMAGDRNRCLASGMDEYIAKPVDMETLQEVIVKAVSARKS